MLARKSALIIATNVANGILGYVAIFFITRYMSPNSYGIMSFAYSFVALFTIIAQAGFDNAHIKRVSEGKDLGRCIGTFMVIRAGLTGLMVVVTVVSILIWTHIMGRGFETSTHELAVYVMLGYWVLHMLGVGITRTFRARREIVKEQIPLLFETLVRVAVTIYVALAGYGAIALVLTYIIGDIVFFLLTLYFLRGYPVKRPSWEYVRDYTVFAFPLVIVVASSLIMTNIDKVLIQLFWSAADVGYYFASFRLCIFVETFALSLGMLLFPTYSALHTSNNIHGIRRLTFQSERYLSMIVFPIVFGLVTLSEPATFILLSNWTEAIPILRILPFFVLLMALEQPYQSQQLGMNRPKLARNRVVLMVVINVLLNFLLIPQDIQILGLELAGMGAMGAAIATVVAYAAGLFYSRYVALHLSGAKGNPRILLHLLAASGMALALYYLNSILYIARWYQLLGFGVLGLGIYLTILVLLKEFTKEDFKFLIDTLNIKKMFTYIRDEIRRQ